MSVMTKMYRLKKAVVPFIKEEHATRIYSLDTWESLQIDIKALEEVKPIFISYGIQSSGNSHNLGGWSQQDGGDFQFTIHFPDLKHSDYDKLSNGRMTRELMDKMQDTINYFYRDFLDNRLEVKK